MKTEREWALDEARREIDGIVDRVGLNAFLDAASPMVTLPKVKREIDYVNVGIWSMAAISVTAFIVGLVVLANVMWHWKWIGMFGIGVSYTLSISAIVGLTFLLCWKAYYSHRHFAASAVWLYGSVIVLAGGIVGLIANVENTPNQSTWWSVFLGQIILGCIAVISSMVATISVFYGIRNPDFDFKDTVTWCEYCGRKK